MIPILSPIAKNFTPRDVTPDLWIDPADISTVWQDAAGTVPVVNSGDPVRLIKDKSVNANHYVAPSDAARPIYRKGAGVAWLEFNGTSQWIRAVANISSFITASTYDVVMASTILTQDQSFWDWDGWGGVHIESSTPAATVQGSNYDGARQFVLQTAHPWVRKIIHQRHTGGNLTLEVDNFGPASVASGNTSSITTPFSEIGNAIAPPGTPLYVGGRLYGIIARKTLFTSGELTSLKTFLMNRFLSAGPGATFIFTLGESNAGGAADNSLLTTAEAAIRPACKIYNPNTLVFEDLHIGFNNLLGHGGLADNATHGPENGITDIEESGNRWPGQLYMLKAGQGGSVMAQWATTFAHWGTLLQRMAAAQVQLDLLGVRPTLYAFLTLGINDAGGAPATSATVMNTGYIDLAVRLREALRLPTLKVCFTKLPTGQADRDAYNVKLATTVLAADPNNLLIDTTTCATNPDGLHWSYAGFKTMAPIFATLVGL